MNKLHISTIATAIISIAAMIQFYQSANFFDASACYKAGSGRSIQVISRDNVSFDTYDGGKNEFHNAFNF